ncbi:MAG: sigma-54 dependent transcriptional regulator [Bacteroidia bacterium]|nr:sigma-54 dependent transcriptional regulator [Bacteroidia bacterium]
MQGTVLILDDIADLRNLLADLAALEGFRVLKAANVRSARQILAREPVQVLLTDVRLPDGDGITLTRQVKTAHPETEVIVLTAYGHIPDGIQAMKNGAFDYLTKGDDNDRILPLLHQAMEKALRQVPAAEPAAIGEDRILGQAPAMLEAKKLLAKVAPAPVAVLLTGETGTGKEVFAQALHALSPRRDRPLVALNCSAFPHDMLESELFGYRAGAFTGALRDQEGLLQAADGGTLFLDEIGEMPPDLQAKLLRVLESGRYYRLGDPKPRQADLRIVAATNRDLLQDAGTGRFREDLYYRLAGFTLHLPPLRERGRDVLLLAGHFTAQAARQLGKAVPALEPGYERLLLQHPWRGNIRELKNVIGRSVLLAESGVLTADTLPLEFHLRHGGHEDPVTLAEAEKQHILRILQQTGHNKARTASLLDIGIATLYRKLQEYGVH